MPDPLTSAEQFMARGLAWTMAKNARSISIQGHPFSGIRNELLVDPQEVKAGGFTSITRFTIAIPRTSLGSFVPKNGMEVVDDVGRKFKIFMLDEDAIRVTITCDNTRK